MGNKQQTINFRNGPRLAERLRELDEKANGLHFHRVQARGTIGLGFDRVALQRMYDSTNIILFNKN